MRVVGTVALEPGRVPGAAVMPLAGDVAAAVRAGLRALARVVVREVAVAVRERGPALVALLAPGRPRLSPLAASPASHPLVSGAGSRLGAAGSARNRGAGTRTRTFELALPADATAPRRARALLQEAARAWAVDDELYHDAAMVVTELVANAVDHARTPSTLTLGLDGRGLRLAVRDGNPRQAPRPRPVDPAAPRGRGLQMVQALAASWGVTQHSDGKTVWAVLGLG
jgi:anti-sigma regulatory factor (Ser/Thr protein kinase)